MKLFKSDYQRPSPLPPGPSTPSRIPNLLGLCAGTIPFARARHGAGSVLPLLAWLAATMPISLDAAELQSQHPLTNSASEVILTLGSSKTTIWQNGIGDGFKPSARTITLEAGAARGIAAFGGRQTHDLALTSLSYGQMFGQVTGGERWYRGNWEIRAELFGGAQFSPSSDWLVGLTPHLRYNFATRSRWIPFLDGGAGVTATGIGPPDVSHTFEFNLQAGTGVHWFAQGNIALTVEARYLHMSCAGINRPNLGLNSVTGMVGLTWFL